GLKVSAAMGGNGPTLRAIIRGVLGGVDLSRRSAGASSLVGTRMSCAARFAGIGASSGEIVAVVFSFDESPAAAPLSIHFFTTAIRAAGSGGPPFGINLEAFVVTRRLYSSLSTLFPTTT